MGQIIDIRELRAKQEEESEMARKKCRNPKIEFMRKYLEAEARIPMKEERIARHREKLYGLGAQDTSGMPKGGAGVSMGDGVIDLLEMIERENADIAELRRLHGLVLDAIEAIPDNEMRTVMEGRYMNAWTWDDIARVVHCDTSTAWRIHGRALGFIQLPQGWNRKNRRAG